MTEQNGKTKGFFSRLSDVLFEEIETSPAPTQTPPVEGKAGGEPPEPAPVDDRLRQDLLQSLAEEGPLFNQFIELAASLAELVPQESASYQAALRALEKTSSAGRDDLLVAVQRQLDALAREKDAFAQSVQKKLAAQQAATRKGDEIRARISELQKSIQTLEQEEQQLLARITNEEKLIRTAQLRFDSTVRDLDRELRGKLEKIRNYLPETPAKETTQTD